MKNKYCSVDVLRNEADVEQNFLRRLLEDLGYSDSEILPKQSLDSLTIGGMRGHAKRKYKPDFGLRAKRKVRWIAEAKARDEKLSEHEWQPRAYCILLNGNRRDEKPVRYHLLTNGDETRLYDPDLNEPLIEMKFTDFVDGNKKFERLRSLIQRSDILNTPPHDALPTLKLEKRSLSEVNAAFAWCHQHIYRKDDISQSDAFTEFVKLIALKLLSDRKIKTKFPEIVENDVVEVPVIDVDFCLHWVDLNERNSHNPINDIQFKNFMDDMEKQIARGERKRIFEINDQIKLKPETVRGVVKRLQNIFLFGIDADLNGRLFETFLNATMRGKDLGQFFTPRSLIKLGVQLSQLRVGANGRQTDKIIDACCGSGGFLIDALADMWSKADKKNISDSERVTLKKEIANNHIVGIDVANAPKLARIARLNMYLHGDGGSRIFHLSALDKSLADTAADNPDILKEKIELRKLLNGDGFDVALTNPPFAKAMDRTTEEENRILDEYDIGRDEGTPRTSLRSSLLFAERYRDLLRVGGRLVTIIDDGILSGDDYKWFRDKLREWFLIRAVISLPGDAFQRSNARVKTSYLIAEKRDPKRKQDQPPVFMYPCRYVGIDDQKRQRERPGDSEARRFAEEEIKAVIAAHEKFLDGDSTEYSVPSTRVVDRLDVKNCLMSPGRSIAAWKKAGFKVLSLSGVLEEREYAEDDIIGKDHPEPVKVLVVRYEGFAESSGEMLPGDGSYSRLYPVSAGDIVISNIAASHGSIAVVPESLDGCVVSSEYTVLTPLEGFDAIVLQLILRSPEIRSDILLTASGANRTRARWDAIRDIKIPYPKDEIVDRVRKFSKESDEAKLRAHTALGSARDLAETSLSLRSEDATTILAAFKPPQ